MTYSYTDSDATQLDTQTAQHNTQGEICTTTLQIVRKQVAQPTISVDIAALITQSCKSIDPRTHANDRDILSFCLHHLFLSTDTLSHITYSIFIDQLSPADEPPPATARNLRQRHSTWTRLRAIKYVLERMESLCQLLNDASRSMLSSLDTETIALSPTTPAVLEEASSATTIQSPSEQLQDALTPILNSWQQRLSEQRHHTFHHCFAHLLSTTSTIPTLAQIDSAFSTLLKSACLLFSDTLPTLNTARREATAIQLLDLMQKIDQMVLQIDVMMTSLHTLIKLHALEAEMK
jgi:hypothetical protein